MALLNRTNQLWLQIEALARRFISAIGWESRFSVIIGGDTVGVSKPDPKPLLETIARAGGGRGAFVGDSITDTTSARAADIPCIALTFGFHDRPPAELGADLLIDHFDQLLPSLERLGLQRPGLDRRERLGAESRT